MSKKLDLSRQLDFYGTVNPQSSAVKVNKIKHELMDYDFKVTDELMEDILFLKEFGIDEDVQISKMKDSMTLELDTFNNYIYNLNFLKWKY